MSKNDIAKMSVKERVALMEALWASFDNGEAYPVPEWHEAVLKQRAEHKDEDFTPFSEAKKEIYEALNAYRNS